MVVMIGVILCVIAIAVMAVLWVKGMEEVFETSTDEIADRKFWSLVYNTKYRIHIRTVIKDEINTGVNTVNE